MPPRNDDCSQTEELGLLFATPRSRRSAPSLTIPSSRIIVSLSTRLPGLVGLVDELWHQGQRERGAGLSCVLPPRRHRFVLPIVLLHHHLLEHTGRHLALHLVATERRRPVLRYEQLETRRCNTKSKRMPVKASITAEYGILDRATGSRRPLLPCHTRFIFQPPFFLR